MTFSAAIMGITGIILTFFPQEIADLFNMADSNTILFQLLGGLYFGFAILNWAARANLTGGIYSRPVVIGNLAHFVIGGLALLKFAMRNSTHSYIWIAVILYLVFALFFGIVMYTNPAMKSKSV
jgi:hypothetical protein